MKRMLKLTLALGIVTSFALCAQAVKSAQRQASTQDKPSSPVKVMREYKGVKLGMKRDQVRVTMQKTESSTDSSDEFKLNGDDTMTVHYENGDVRAIQLAFLDPKNAPAWNDVVGDAEVSQTDSGAKHARKVVQGENFWVSIYQSKDGMTTRITISR